jgi:RNA polymerase sigma-70 factor (ECF subfamily)
MNDQQRQLVSRIQAGEAAAKKELFERYQNPIFWKISRAVQAEAFSLEDLASEVYLALLQELSKTSFQPGQWISLDAFVWGVTNNKIRDWFKKQKRGRQVFEDHPPAEEIAAAAEEYRFESEELTRALKSCMNTLQPEYKEALDLRYFKEFSISEISAQLDLPSRRVSERIHYALKLLRIAWKKPGKGASIFALLGLFLYRGLII